MTTLYSWEFSVCPPEEIKKGASFPSSHATYYVTQIELLERETTLCEMKITSDGINSRQAIAKIND